MHNPQTLLHNRSLYHLLHLRHCRNRATTCQLSFVGNCPLVSFYDLILQSETSLLLAQSQVRLRFNNALLRPHLRRLAQLVLFLTVPLVTSHGR